MPEGEEILESTSVDDGYNIKTPGMAGVFFIGNII